MLDYFAYKMGLNPKWSIAAYNLAPEVAIMTIRLAEQTTTSELSSQKSSKEVLAGGLQG